MFQKSVRLFKKGVHVRSFFSLASCFCQTSRSVYTTDKLGTALSWKESRGFQRNLPNLVLSPLFVRRVETANIMAVHTSFSTGPDPTFLWCKRAFIHQSWRLRLMITHLQEIFAVMPPLTSSETETSVIYICGFFLCSI